MIEKITVTVLKNKMFLRITFFLWLITITILSVMPSPDMADGVSDKLSHFIAYFVTTAWLCLAFKRARFSYIFLYSLFVFFYSTGIEVIQYFLPYRDFSVGDILANISGIITAAFIYSAYLEVK